MYPRELGNYGAPFVDQEVVVDPTTQQSAGQANILFEDVAQLTRMRLTAWARFQTANSGTTAGIIAHASLWGSTGGFAPTGGRLSAGTYTLTYASQYTDGLSNAENVVLRAAWGNAAHPTGLILPHCVVSGTVVTIYLRDAAGSLTDGSATDIDIFII